MLKYNALIGLPKPAADKLESHRDEVGKLPSDVPNGEWASRMWRDPVIGGTQWIVYDTQGESPTDADKLAQNYEGIIFGLFNRRTGDPIRSLHPKIMEIMNDDVEHDEDGNEVSRSRPSAPRDEHLWAGQHPRKWS